MKIEEQVVSYELAIKLKELGIKQESLFYWVPSFSTVNGKYEIKKWFVRKQNKANNRYNEISAFTASELLEILPEDFKDIERNMFFSLTIRHCYEYHVGYYSFVDGKWLYGNPDDSEFEENNLCDALAKMLSYLTKNNLII